MAKAEVPIIKIDLEELDEAMLNSSHSRSYSDDARPRKATKIVTPVDPPLKLQGIPLRNLNEGEDIGRSPLEEEKKSGSDSTGEQDDETGGLTAGTGHLRFFRDDSVLICASTMRERRKQYEQLLAEKKIARGKDRTHVICVLVPTVDADADTSFLMEEFEFHLDKSGVNYEFQFGHSLLTVFDWRKYQRMLRSFK